MLKNRILLGMISVALIISLFMLPKVVVRNEQASPSVDSLGSIQSNDPHTVATELVQTISRTRTAYLATATDRKSAIFADSLAGLYTKAGKFDSAAWFADTAATFFNTIESWTKAGNAYYEAFTFAMDQTKQNELAKKAQEYFEKILSVQPTNLDVKSRLAMTYMSSVNPMQGVTLLREVLAADPKNETALFNLGMLSIQSGQYERAISRLTDLISINPNHIQGLLLLGVAYMNSGNQKLAREQFDRVKQLDKDPAVQATVDSYLKDLK